MTFQAKLLCAVAVVGVTALAATAPAQALTMQECSAKYKAAKDAGTLSGQKWNDFRKSQCGADATAAAAPAAPAAEAKPKTPAAAPMSMGNAVFPNAVDPKYSKETAGKARIPTSASPAAEGQALTDHQRFNFCTCSKSVPATTTD